MPLRVLVETAFGVFPTWREHGQITNSQEVVPDRASNCLNKLPWAWLSAIFGYDKPHLIRPQTLGMDSPTDSRVSGFLPSYGVLM